MYDLSQSDPLGTESAVQQQHKEDEELNKPDPQSRTARKRRTDKLSQFFGESVDLSKPLEERANTVPRARLQSASASRHATGGGRWKRRRDTIDAMLGEMWQSVQTEMGRGGLKKDEVDRLGDLMCMLRERKRERNGYWESV